MHSVCRCSIRSEEEFSWRRGPPWPIFALPWIHPGRIWPKNNHTCKGPWVLHPYQVSTKSIKRFWRRSWKCESLRTDGRTDDGRCAMAIAHLSLRQVLVAQTTSDFTSKVSKSCVPFTWGFSMVMYFVLILHKCWGWNINFFMFLDLQLN